MTRDLPISITVVDPELPAARACLGAYLALLTERIPAMPVSHVPVPDPDAHRYRAPDGVFLLATRGDEPLGCVSLKKIRPGIAEVKRLWVDPAARGTGLAHRLMDHVEAFARSAGYVTLWLDTNENLTEALAFYRGRGWHVIAPYTEWPATHWFGKAL